MYFFILDGMKIFYHKNMKTLDKFSENNPESQSYYSYAILLF